MLTRARILIASAAVLLAPLTACAAEMAHEAVGEAEAVTLVPHHVAWVRVILLGIMWLFLAAIGVGLIVAPFNAAPVARPHSTDPAHH